MAGVARLLALLCWASGAESALDKHHPTILVENLRKQLMNENYDYMPSASEELVPHETTPPPPARDHVEDLDSDINDHFIRRTNELNHTDVLEDGVSKKDLLYYLDDDRLEHEAAEKDVATAKEETTTESSSTTVKYKVLKVYDPHPSRRSKTFRRFIQEEGVGGLAIISLDEAPLPEFRLPRARRQYMLDRREASDLELAPHSDK